MAITHDDKYIIVAGDHKFCIYNAENGQISTPAVNCKDFDIQVVEIALDDTVAYLAGNQTEILIVNLQKPATTYGELQRLSGHNSPNIWQIAITDDKDDKYFISRSEKETILWSYVEKEPKIKFHIESEFVIMASSGRICQAFLHEGLFKNWNQQSLKDLNEEFNIENDAD